LLPSRRPDSDVSLAGVEQLGRLPDHPMWRLVIPRSGGCQVRRRWPTRAAHHLAALTAPLPASLPTWPARRC